MHKYTHINIAIYLHDLIFKDYCLVQKKDTRLQSEENQTDLDCRSSQGAEGG